MKPKDLNAQEPAREPGAPESTAPGGLARRDFVTLGAAIGAAVLGGSLVQGCAPGELTGTSVAALTDPRAPLPDSTDEALAIYSRSGEARTLTEWLGARYGLRLDRSRAFVFVLPPARELPPDVTVEEMPSLVGESAYSNFLRAAREGGRLTAAQYEVLASSSRTQIAANLGGLVNSGAEARSGCSCSTSSSCGCSSSSSSCSGTIVIDISLAALHFGGTTSPAPGAHFFGASMTAHGDNAVAVVFDLVNDAAMTVAGAVILTVEDGRVVQTRVDPRALG